MKVDFDIRAAWAILVHVCHAPNHLWGAFEHHIRHGGQEFRFQGKLGFGGKVWHQGGRLFVTCYPEDITPERSLIMSRANDALEKLLKPKPAGANQ